MDINNTFNFAQCIKEAHSIGANWFTNICTGNVTKVAWGSLDWAHYLTVTAIMTVVIGLIAAAFIGMTIEYKKENNV